MKRNYIQPATETVAVYLQGLPLATSKLGVSTENYDENTMTDLVKSSPSSSSVWDDDWSAQ